jgi:hypothetical protein
MLGCTPHGLPAYLAPVVHVIVRRTGHTVGLCPLPSLVLRQGEALV